MSRFNFTSPEAMPMDGTLCEVITESGDVRNLFYERGLWWLPDRSMYVYFTPTHWRYLT